MLTVQRRTSNMVARLAANLWVRRVSRKRAFSQDRDEYFEDTQPLGRVADDEYAGEGKPQLYYFACLYRFGPN